MPTTNPPQASFKATRARPGRTRLAGALTAVLCWAQVLAPLQATAQSVAKLPATEAPLRLPALGESASDDFSVSAERRVGDQVMREGRRDPAYLDDPVLLEYLQSIWQPLVAAARKKGDIDPEIDRAFAWESFLVRDRSVNAFAMAGGYVGVHLGLIAITTTADQLASVLAHELTHVTQRHIARSIAPQQQASMLALVGMLLAVALAGRSNSADGVNAAIMGGQAAAIQTQLNYSRDMEREADRIGFGVLGAAGFSTAGMAAMFDRMDLATRLSDNSSYPYLRSHPLTVDRISEARNRTLFAGAKPSNPTLTHAVMQARARVLMDDSTQNLQRLNGGTSSSALTDRVAALYAGALAASLLREHTRAAQQLDEALQLARTASPREPAAERAITLQQAAAALARNDAPAALLALDSLQSSANTGPERATLLLRGQALLQDQRQNSTRNPAAHNTAVHNTALRETTEALQTWLADQPQDALAWDVLAATSQALGLQLRSMRAAAEARAVVGDLTGAIDRLRVAQQASRTAVGQDFIEGSVIDARLRQLVAQRRQIALEAREGRTVGRPGPEEPLPQ
jgi:beta-barrel assembly-enhancing protease